MSKMVFNRYHQLLEFTCDRCGSKCTGAHYMKEYVIIMRKSIPLFKVYRKDILTGDVDVFNNLDQRTVERRTGQLMAFRDHWEGGKAWERYKYIVIRKGGAWDNERKNQLFAGW